MNAIDIIDRRLAVLRRGVLWMDRVAPDVNLPQIATRIDELESLRSELIDNEPQEAA